MSAIKKVENLSQAHLDYIILALSKTSELEEVRQSFQTFFETGVSGEVLMKVFSDNHVKIGELKDKTPFSEKTKAIRIADPVQQLQLLDELYDSCLVPRTVNITREGEEITKVDHPTALRCVEAASKIRIAEMTLELKRHELSLLGDGGSGSGKETAIEGEVTRNTGPVINIVHRREED